MSLDYMKWVTNNVLTFVPNTTNEVACVYCRKIYETKTYRAIHNCLVCEKCGIDALMVVSHSPLQNLAEHERIALLDKWYDYGFGPIP